MPTRNPATTGRRVRFVHPPLRRAWCGALAAALVAGAAALGASDAAAQTPQRLRIGILNDQQSGFSAWSGKGSVVAAQMAVEDFAQSGGKLPYRVEVIAADHQNKPDVGSSVVRKWLDEGVNAVVDIPNSAVALATNFLVKNTDAVMLVSGGGHDALTAKECSPNLVHWTFDLWSIGKNTAEVAVKRGGDTWFFATSDFAGGHGLEAVASSFAKQAGARVLGNTRQPLGTADYSSAILQAQASKAKVVGIAMGGSDFVNFVKQAGEFGLADEQRKLVALAVFLTDVHGLGLKAAQGLTFTTSFYWDMDEGKRAFAQRFAKLHNGNYPTDVQAGVYASVLHYLKAVQAAETTKGPAVVSKMKDMPTDDPLFGRGRIRQDGRKIHDMHVMEVKKPAESRGAWDYLKLVGTIPGDQAFRPLSDDCPLVKR